MSTDSRQDPVAARVDIKLAVTICTGHTALKDPAGRHGWDPVGHHGWDPAGHHGWHPYGLNSAVRFPGI